MRDILARKGSAIFSVEPGATVLEAARLMNERVVGGVLVLVGAEAVGIFTERDVLRRVVAERRDPAATTVREVMTSPVLVCRPDTSVEDCAAIMTSRRIRHLPVGDGAGLQGVVTIGDVLAFQVAEQETTIEALSRYVYDVR
ncbi:MAG TPA: CBS domain-containing protein [Gemmatimonadaceae bacterium]|nr:CBS domain-containing protein [Gemmatimonadaceae bacterium]